MGAVCMAMFKRVATWQLVVVLVEFLLGNSYLLHPTSPDCCSDTLYPRLALLAGLFFLTSVAAATMLLSVLMTISSAHAKGAKPDAAYKVSPAGWKLRALLLLAIALSAESSFLLVPTIETGYGYLYGCVYSRDPWAVVAMVIMGIQHGSAAFLVAVAQD